MADTFVTVDSCILTTIFIATGRVLTNIQAPVTALTRLGAVNPALVTPAAVMFWPVVEIAVVPIWSSYTPADT